MKNTSSKNAVVHSSSSTLIFVFSIRNHRHLLVRSYHLSTNQTALKQKPGEHLYNIAVCMLIFQEM